MQLFQLMNRFSVHGDLENLSELAFLLVKDMIGLFTLFGKLNPHHVDVDTDEE